MTVRELERLLEERAGIYDQMREINDRADTEGRDLRPHEQRQYDSLERRFDQMTETIEAGEREHGAGRLSPADARRGGPGERAARDDTPLLGREERMRDWAARHADRSSFSADDVEDFCLGNIMRALVDPGFRDQLNDVEARALAEGTGASGGFWTPEILSTNVIDRIRSAMRVMEAGATTVPLNSDQQSIPRLSGGVTGAWRTENSAFATTQPTFDRVTFTPQSYGFLVLTSEELYQDMVPGAGRILEREFSQAAALELDRAALRGSGAAPEPRGVRNQAGVTIQSLGANGATPTRYTELMTAITTLLGNNRVPDGVILAPRTSQFYGGLIDTTNQPLQPPRPVADLPFYVTNQIPTNLTQGTSTDTSEEYVGYWPDLLIGIRLGIQLRLLTERYADTGQYAWRVFMRADVQLQHPESFVVITGVRP